MAEPVVGVVGGLGPESTIRLMQAVFDATPAEREQDHIHLIVDSNPKTPDRSQALLGEGESPAPTLCESVRRLTGAGADLIAVACNTAHAFHDEMQAATAVPVLHMIELCARRAGERWPAGATLGLLATTGTVRSGLYQDALGREGRTAAAPEPPEQAELMDAIFGAGGIKLGRVEENAPRVAALGRALMDRGAVAVIAGCTEVGLALAEPGYPVIDPLRLLAEEIVRRVKGER